MKRLIIALILTGVIAIGAKFTVFSSPFYRVNTPVNKNLVTVNLNGSPSVPGTGPKGSGICAPPGCGYPATGDRENVSLTLTPEQITSLVSEHLPPAVPLSDVRVSISEETIYASANSTYPFLPGRLSASARLDLNHFYVKDVYVGGLKAPQKVANFVEANMAGLIDNAFARYGVKLLEMKLVGGNLFLKANAPKGTVVVNKDGTIILNLKEVSADPSYADPNNRF